MAKIGHFMKCNIYETLEIRIIERHRDSNVVSIGFCSSFDSPFLHDFASLCQDFYIFFEFSILQSYD